MMPLIMSAAHRQMVTLMQRHSSSHTGRKESVKTKDLVRVISHKGNSIVDQVRLEH